MNKNISRRSFMGQASCAAIGSSTFLNSLLNLNLINATASYRNTTGYKALVCILLAGGNDSYNMLPPKGSPEYEEYAAIRSGLALEQDDILSLTNPFNNGKELGLHPSMSEVQSLYDQGNIAFLANVGTLVEPTDLNQYENQLVTLPKGLFSHSDQIQQWQTSIPQSKSATGWGGRMADVLSSLNTNQNVSMNISLSGVNVFQVGSSVFPFSITPNGSIGINGYGMPAPFNVVRTEGIDSLLNQHYANIFQGLYGDTVQNAQMSHEEFSDAIDNIVPLVTTFNQANSLSRNLEMVAKTISARDILGFSRQTFFITFGGWDHHDEVLDNQLAMLATVSEALNEFYNALIELGLTNEVTTFSISDFGRTLSSNGNGSDHAWGGNHLIMGGAVNGNQIYGTYPDLYEGNPQDVGRGRLLPTTSADEYFADLALWFGADSSDLDMILPNIYNFVSPGITTGPIGIMGV